ncbi:MAG: phage major capsid protein [Acidaminococcaceae bacterium]
MDKKPLNVRQLVSKYQTNCDRISEIADTCEKEQRERSEAETKEFEAIARDNQLLQMRMQVAAAEHLRENPNARQDAVKIIRENAARGQKTEITFVREIMVVSDVTNSGVVPLNIQDILKPLTEGFILDKVGLPMPTGLAGDYVWPVYEMVEATVLGEGAALGDSKIPFSKLSANPARMGIAIPVSNQSINQTDGVLETIVREIMPQSIRLLLNKILMSTTAINAAASTAGLVGPFVAAAAKAVALSSVPTFQQLNQAMKAKVLESGIDGEHLCWVMTKSMEAILEGTPINEKGIFVPMVQGGRLCGLPIYTTNAIRKGVKSYQKYTAGSTNAWAAYTLQDGDAIEYKVSGDTAARALATISSPAGGKIAEVTVVTEYIGLGDWRYQPMGLFGAMRFVVDPYSQARKDAVDFVLNVDYGTKTLRPEGFIIGQVAPTA